MATASSASAGSAVSGVTNSGNTSSTVSAPSTSTVVLTKEEEAEFREIFNLVDKDHGGTISKEELAQLMETLRIYSSQVRFFLLGEPHLFTHSHRLFQEDFEQMINEIDKNDDGEIQFEGDHTFTFFSRCLFPDKRTDLCLFSSFVSTFAYDTEFVAVMARKVNATYTIDEVRASFKVSMLFHKKASSLYNLFGECVVSPDTHHCLVLSLTFLFSFSLFSLSFSLFLSNRFLRETRLPDTSKRARSNRRCAPMGRIN